MKKIIASIILLTVLLSFCNAIITTEHCWRQDKDRQVSITTNVIGSYGTNAEYDYLLQPGSSIEVSGAGTYNIACDNGATNSTKNYIALKDTLTGDILATNVSPNGAPQATTAAGCYDNSGNACFIYIQNGTIKYSPAKGSCGLLTKPGSTAKYSVGAGVENSISYVFPTDKFGEREISVLLGAVSPETATSPDSPKITYRTLKTLKLFIGKPSLLTFAPEKRRLLSTFEETGDQNIEFFFSLMNPSPSMIKLENYSIDCPSTVDCYLEKGADGNNLYKGFTIGSGGEMIIPAIIKVDRSKAPISFAIGMNFTYNGVSQNCGADGNACTVSTELSRIDFALADQQKFQVEIKANIDQVGCIGEDGMTGQTGEDFAPRVNLSFGNETSPVISLNECDRYLQNGNDNNTWVYCSQEEFLTELAAKIAELGALREQIIVEEIMGRYSNAEVLRLEEAKLLNFESYLRAQTFSSSEISESIDETKNYIMSFALSSGLELLESDKAIQADRFSKIINAINFNITNEGVLQDSKDISAGLYHIRIDLNELNESLQSNYLFNTVGELNPALDLKVNLEKIQDPNFDWFFYNSESNNLSEDFNLTYIPDTTNMYTTNVSKRGVVLEYSKGSDGVEDTSFFRTYAVPFVVRLDADTNGQTNGRLKLTTTEIADQFNPTDGVFSYWTGFASSIEDGCVSTISSGETTLPYRVPDLVKNTLGEIEFNSFDYPMLSAKENSKMYLQTVLYMPKGMSLNIVSPMKMYTNTSTCSNPQDTNCLIAITENALTGRVYDLGSAFDAIREQKLCVNKKVSANGEVWILFWNQNEMLKLISERKTNIVNHVNNDANICQTREILGG